jgi:AAA domain
MCLLANTSTLGAKKIVKERECFTRKVAGSFAALASYPLSIRFFQYIPFSPPKPLQNTKIPGTITCMIVPAPLVLWNPSPVEGRGSVHAHDLASSSHPFPLSRLALHSVVVKSKGINIMSKKRPTPALPKELRSPMSKTLPLTEGVVLPYTPLSVPTKQSVCPKPSEPSPTNNESLAGSHKHTASQASIYPKPSEPSSTNNETLAGSHEHTALKASIYPKPSEPSPADNESLVGLPEHTASQASVYPKPSQPSPTSNPSLADLPEHKTLANLFIGPSPLSPLNLAQASSQPVRWLWQDRLPLSGITLLDGDHSCGKSLLALQLAAHISSGTALPDGTPTLQGGVVIITPHRDVATTQLQLLSAWGADLSRVEVLSYVHDPDNSSHPSGYRPFSLPEDLPRLLEAIDRVNAHLIILDPFIDLLSCGRRWTDQRLGQLLADLNQCLLERGIACLIVRNCGAKGSLARPSVLERSERFQRVAASRLLMARDPMQPDHLLLAHVDAHHTALALAPTLRLRVLPNSLHPDLPHVTSLGTHSLKARDLLTHRPDALHRRLLSDHLLALITATTNPIHVSALYARSPHSSPFQIQRSLKDLLNIGQIERPARGFYSPAPSNPVFTTHTTVATTPEEQKASALNIAAATTPEEQKASSLNMTAATTPEEQKAVSLNMTAATTPEEQKAVSLNIAAATTPEEQKAVSLNMTAATTPDEQKAA